MSENYSGVIGETLPDVDPMAVALVGVIQFVIGFISYSLAYNGHAVLAPLEGSVGVSAAGFAAIVGGIAARLTEVVK